MAVSAYDEEGRLKKHPLRGTSLGTDPKQVKQKRRFKLLHEAAKGSGDQKAVAERMDKKFSEYQADQTSKLDRITKRQTELEGQYKTASRADSGSMSPYASSQDKAPLLNRLNDEWKANKLLQDQRTQRLADRAKLYRMFLGM